MLFLYIFCGFVARMVDKLNQYDLFAVLRVNVGTGSLNTDATATAEMSCPQIP